MIMRLIIILLSFVLVFGQDRSNDKKKKKEAVFSNDQSTEDYLNVLKKTLDLLEQVNDMVLVSDWTKSKWKKLTLQKMTILFCYGHFIVM